MEEWKDTLVELEIWFACPKDKLTVIDPKKGRTKVLE